MKNLYASFFVLIVLASACKKEKHDVDLPPLTGKGTPVEVTVDPGKAQYSVPDNFLGFSYETEMLTKNPQVLNSNNAVLIQLYKNLGPGILRIGGDSSDEIAWMDGDRSGSTPDQTLTHTEINKLADFSKAAGWKVMLSLNFGTFDTGSSTKEAVYADQALGSNLAALQIGNEPDVYAAYSHLRQPTWMYNDYDKEWRQYFAAIRQALPNSQFVGPDASYNTDWFTSFAGSLNGDVSQLTMHYYRTGPASSPLIDYQSMLDPDFKLPNIFTVTSLASSQYHLPYRITESNSVYGSGKPGVSDVFASSLWALDFLWQLAANRGGGVNFHNVMGSSYSAVDYATMAPKPEYYSMLAFRYAAKNGSMIPVTLDNSSGYKISAYATVKPDQSVVLTLVNKDTAPFSFTVQSGQLINSAQIARLSAPSITSTTGITLGSGAVNADGTFSLTASENQTVNAKRFLVELPALSAAVVTFK